MLSTDEVLTRGVEAILPTKSGLKALMEKRKITLYQGFDPSMPSLHLGNYVGLLKLSQFQKLGHKVIFLVGDFTGMIGDPSGKSTARTPLTREQVRENAKFYKDQASKVLSFSGPNPAEIRYNSEWSDKLSPIQFIQISSFLTSQQIVERDMFQKRQQEGKDIYMNEFLYPMMQAYDSVALNVNLEIGGNDQIFNMLMGRKLMRNMMKREKFVLATKLLVDKEGNKVGKTTGNALFLDSTPENFYGGIMSFPDEVLPLAFEILTELPLENLTAKIKADPMGEKKRLAHEIVKILWGENAADKAQNNWRAVYTKQVKVISKEIPLLDLVFASKQVASRSEAKRLIQQKAVEIDQKIFDNPTEEIFIPKNGLNLKIGKKIFIKICS